MYVFRWTARSRTDTVSKTLHVRLVARGVPFALSSSGPVEVVLAGPGIPPVTVGGKRKPKVLSADGVDNAFDIAGTGSGDVQVMVVDVDQFGVSFVHDLHTVFPTMKIVALSTNPKLLAAALKSGASVALPSSTPSPTLATVIARLLKRP